MYVYMCVCVRVHVRVRVRVLWKQLIPYAVKVDIFFCNAAIFQLSMQMLIKAFRCVY